MAPGSFQISRRRCWARTFIGGVSTSRQPKPSEQQVVDRVSKRRSEPVGQVRCCAFN